MIRDPKTIEDIKANREEWAQALESGKYTQATGRLREKDTFCCLGVLCDLYDARAWRQVDGQIQHFVSLPDDLPDIPVLQAVGLLGEDDTDQDEYYDLPYFLAKRNDDGASFQAIAQLIRRAPLPTEVPS